jgi:hypothetical protein
MWEPRPLTTLGASTACYRDRFSLEYRTMDKVQKLINPDCHTPPSGPFRTYQVIYFLEGIYGHHVTVFLHVYTS